MTTKVLFKIFGLFLLFLQICNQCFALEKETHKEINEHIAKTPINGFSLNAYLVNQLGYKNGIQEIFFVGDSGMEVWNWIREGGKFEDEPFYTRSFAHFHDPMKPWGIAGYKGIFTSSIVWAQNQEGVSLLIGGDQSWKKARDSFYKGLRGISKINREKNFADTFRALGQVMHLVQDTSVPAHVRNDGHVYINIAGVKIGRYHYEVWVKNHQGELSLTPLGFDQSILNIKPDLLAPIPIANIFDTNKYQGLDDINVATGINIGLSEYTNANFFSEGTIFKNYPHPTYGDTNYPGIDWRNPEALDAEDGKLDHRIYIKKTTGEPISRLASLSYISFDLFKKAFYIYSPLILDDEVYKEYASKLIPRAVGYSAGLLEYFFRGIIKITDPIIDNDQLFPTITLKVKNTTPNDEEMTGGDNASIMLVVKYKVPSGQDYLYIVASEKNDMKSIPRGNPIELTFDLSLSPLPIDATDISFQVVYKGELGKAVGNDWVGEEDAVAVGLKTNESPYLIAWYRNNEGAGSVVKNYATDGSLGGGLLPDLDVTDPDLYWDMEGFGHSQSDSINWSLAGATFNERTLSADCAFGVFFKKTKPTNNYDYSGILNLGAYGLAAQVVSKYEGGHGDVIPDQNDRSFDSSIGHWTGGCVRSIWGYQGDPPGCMQIDVPAGQTKEVVLSSPNVYMPANSFMAIYWPDFWIHTRGGIASYPTFEITDGNYTFTAPWMSVSSLGAPADWNPNNAQLKIIVSSVPELDGIIYIDIPATAPGFMWFWGGYVNIVDAFFSGAEFNTQYGNDIDDNWFFFFVDDSLVPKMVKSDGSLGEMSDSWVPLKTIISSLSLGGVSNPDSDIVIGDVIIYNNYIAPQSEWAAWYDTLRGRYGMAGRIGW